MRKKGIRNYCKTHNLEYYASTNNLPTVAKNSNLLKSGDKNFFEEVMTGTQEGIKYYIFDYKYIMVFGLKNQNIGYKTICIFELELPLFPTFLIYENNPNFNSSFLNSQIEQYKVFIEDKNFSNKLTIFGLDKKPVIDFFNEKNRYAFLKYYLKNCNYESNTNFFIVSKSNKMDINERLSFLNNNLKLLQELINK